MVTKGHIAMFSPLAVANGNVRPWPTNICFIGPTLLKQHLGQPSRPYVDWFSHFRIHYSKGV